VQHLVPDPHPPRAGLRERKKSERRARIAAAASHIFRAKGYDAATLREIAASADVGTGTLFSYARDKRELLMMAVNDELGALTENAFRTVPPEAALHDQLLHVFGPRLEYWARDPELARHALHMTSGAPYDSETGRFVAARAGMTGLLIALLAPHQSAGVIDPALDLATAARFIVDVYIGENRRWLATQIPIVPDGMSDLAQMLTLGLRAIAPARSTSARK
jgi:AcrR family transcriptional regulator